MICKPNEKGVTAMPTTAIEGVPAGLTVEPCTCGCSHKTLAELLSDNCKCGCDCHSEERLESLRSAADKLGVDLNELARAGTAR